MVCQLTVRSKSSHHKLDGGAVRIDSHCVEVRIGLTITRLAPAVRVGSKTRSALFFCVVLVAELGQWTSEISAVVINSRSLLGGGIRLDRPKSPSFTADRRLISRVDGRQTIGRHDKTHPLQKPLADRVWASVRLRERVGEWASARVSDVVEHGVAGGRVPLLSPLRQRRR
ncbi:unnamed protein product [Soboliphyme baturini]|uniref:Uncharacterized protein n=1 Tax=Soboliphyme baturini TaxID=241478 RepID=A0A183IIM1_9BILA|nr:unnamed protein product [Soboliphyme baturini]